MLMLIQIPSDLATAWKTLQNKNGELRGATYWQEEVRFMAIAFNILKIDSNTFLHYDKQPQPLK